MAVDWNDLFASLGAEPVDWLERDDARTREQLPRFLFLHQAWRAIVSGVDDAWIDREIAQAEPRPDAPFAGVGLALSRLVTSGAERADLAEVVRGLQASLLFEFAYLLSDPGFDDETLAILETHGVRAPAWALVECDEDGQPTTREIGCLHESVLASDPTAREMRPARP